jgi:23S rRNA pseudouridine2605 synthase
LTAEQLEAARAERMRQNGHGAITIEDVRTWIEETGLCIFLPRSAQAGFTAPTFVEAVAGQRTTEPTLELIASAESLLVRLEAEGVAVRLNLAGQPGDQPDYVVAGWVLPYIYALRGDRDWRRSPQLTGSRQVSQLAVQAAKQLETANLTAAQIRDLLGRETTETAVLRALHELWKQLRVIPVVPEVSSPALWQPLRQRFQKAIAEGASTSQVTAISVLASIYLQAVIAASMEDVEMFLSPLTSRSKIREVVRGLAATRQVHSTTMGHSPMFYVAGTLPDFPAVPSYQIGTSQSSYRSSNYRTPAYLDSYSDLPTVEDEIGDSVDIIGEISVNSFESIEIPALTASAENHEKHFKAEPEPLMPRRTPPSSNAGPSKAAAPRPRPVRSGSAVHPRERSRSAAGAGTGGSRRAPAPRTAASNGSGARSTAGQASGRPAAGRSHNGSSHNASGIGHGSNGHSSNGHGHANGNGHHANGKSAAKPTVQAKNGAQKHGAAAKPSRPAWGSHATGVKSNSAGGAKSSNGAHARPDSRHPKTNASAHASANGASKGPAKGVRNGSSSSRPVASNRPVAKAGARPASRPHASSDAGKRTPVTASASKRLSFSGQAKQAPKPAAKRTGKPTAAVSSARSGSSAATKRRG